MSAPRVVAAMLLTALVTAAAMYLLRHRITSTAILRVRQDQSFATNPGIAQASHSSGPALQATASDSLLVPPEGVELPNSNTVTKCWRMESWGDVCVYDNICWDGHYFIFMDSLGPVNLQFAPSFTGQGDMLEGVILPTRPVTKAADEFIPFNAGQMHAKRVHHDAIRDTDSFKVTWMNSTLWRLPFEFPIENTWYTASRVLPIYRARKMNESGWFNPPLPPMDAEDFFFTTQPAYPFQTEWTRNVLGLSSGNRSRVEYGDGVWNKQWSPNNVVCFKHAVASGAFAAGVPDAATAFQFRREMYEYMGVPLPLKPAKKVLFWFRTPPLGRSILNTEAILRLTESYDVPFTHITEFPRDFKNQLRLFSSHGVMVSPHGAGLMNVMFLVPFSSVIEIFPYHLDHNIYSTASITSGLGYYPVHTYNGSDMWTRDELNFKLNCEALTIMQSNHVHGNCRDPCIHYRIEVGLRDFEAALVNALEHSGFRTRFRGIAPTPDNSTATGWK